MTAAPTLTLYTRAGCHLCEDAEATLTRLGVPYTPVDVTGHADLEARYGWDVPVLARGDQVLLKGVLSAARITAKLRVHRLT
ncbi:glutaredoxin family protein [Deinococcus maricopensis]|uniref:Glutaredoxin 2 n=1 Tax=Deinococcus maricopensis (strain DSM 21211 / LMG 22137 / NRRL B-23946 / LB-34) TaxID=709986 RepID=E8U6Z9_DEIML|nr:glutaredoxin family protein [Deinococcus maricopensis]ADV66838.1 glutaredoxin 2 [Deinococcus maricopensis DSM 21211]